RPAALTWKLPSAAWTLSTPGPSVRPSAWRRKARSTASMQSRRLRRSSTSRRERTSVEVARATTTSGLAGRGGIQAFEERHPLGEHLVVVGRGGQERADGDVDPPRLLVRVLAVPEVRLVHDLSQPGQAPIAQARPLDQRLERAVLAVVAQLHAGGVEGDGVLRKLRRRREGERRLGVDEAL